ncbi:hypothetical protein APASM_4579 [Actinosynnema pretiosum subsp. pretiosum]|nr:hypothetical protein APASM_4579 [Actinosynnema pretiosum subsp. pretiosum]
MDTPSGHDVTDPSEMTTSTSASVIIADRRAAGWAASSGK